MAGLQIMHNGKAIELIEHLRDDAKGQVWRAKPLFVVGSCCEVTIRPQDECRALHTERLLKR